MSANPSPPQSEPLDERTGNYMNSQPIKVITFDDLVQTGIDQGVPLYNGMPWSFVYEGYPVSHENDDLYLIITPTATLRFYRGDILELCADHSLCVGKAFRRPASPPTPDSAPPYRLVPGSAPTHRWQTRYGDWLVPCAGGCGDVVMRFNKPETWICERCHEDASND